MSGEDGNTKGAAPLEARDLDGLTRAAGRMLEGARAGMIAQGVAEGWSEEEIVDEIARMAGRVRMDLKSYGISLAPTESLRDRHAIAEYVRGSLTERTLSASAELSPDPDAPQVARSLTRAMLQEGCSRAKKSHGPRYSRDVVAGILNEEMGWPSYSGRTLKRAQDDLRIPGWPPRFD